MERQKIRTLPDDLKSAAQELFNEKFPEKELQSAFDMSIVTRVNTTTSDLLADSIRDSMIFMKSDDTYNTIPVPRPMQSRPIQYRVEYRDWGNGRLYALKSFYIPSGSSLDTYLKNDVGKYLEFYGNSISVSLTDESGNMRRLVFPYEDFTNNIGYPATLGPLSQVEGATRYE